MLNRLLLIILFICAIISCDDGYVIERAHDGKGEGFTVKLTGEFSNIDSWQGSYDIVLAGFDEVSDYSIIQKSIPTSKGSNKDTIILRNVSTSVTSVEIAVVNTLRKRIASIYAVPIKEEHKTGDTVMIDAGTLDLGMFNTINKVVFQDMSCSRCHSSPNATAKLDLSSDNAYHSIVNSTSHVNPSSTRVIPGNSEDSYLYKVITTGVPEINYSHPKLFAEERYETYQTIIKKWIDNGAKE